MVETNLNEYPPQKIVILRDATALIKLMACIHMSTN